MNVDIKKAEGVLKLMVPEYILKYIESDLQLVDEIKSVTFLKAHITHVSEFNSKVVP